MVGRWSGGLHAGQLYPDLSELGIWLWTGCASLTQNEAGGSFSAGLEAQFNRLESNHGAENGVEALWGKSCHGAHFTV